jgi:hypothetical protein
MRAHHKPGAVGRHLHRRRVAEVGGQRARPRLRAAAQVPTVHHAALRREGEQRLRVPRQVLDSEHRALAGRGYGAHERGVDYAQRRLRRVALRRHAVVARARARAHPPLLLAAARGPRHAHAPVLDFEDVHGAVGAGGRERVRVVAAAEVEHAAAQERVVGQPRLERHVALEPARLPHQDGAVVAGGGEKRLLCWAVVRWR